MNNNKINKLISNFEQKYDLYKDFGENVKQLLQKLLNTNNIKYQNVTFRVKEKESLKNKLENKSDIKKITDINDLVGCRIILYLEKDINSVGFLLQKEFEIVNIKNKFSTDNYNAYHIIIKLKDNRLKLTEYSRFKNIKCEIQITTVLFHAWAEMAHDMIYKDKNFISTFDKKSFNRIQRNFNEIMKKHLKKAQYTFEDIFNEKQQIIEGKEIFNSKEIENILSLQSNDDIFLRLQNLNEKIRKFGNKIPRDCNIINILKKIIIKTKSNTDFLFIKYSSILTEVLKTLEFLKFHYTKEIIDFLLELSTDDNEKNKEKLKTTVEKFSKYLYIKDTKQIDFTMQYALLNKFENFSKQELLKYFDFIIISIYQIFSTEINYCFKKNYKYFCCENIKLPHNKYITKIKKRAFNILTKTYLTLNNVYQKQQIINIFSNTYDNNVKLQKQVNDIVNFYLKIINNEENETIRVIELSLRDFPQDLNSVIILKKKILSISNYKLYKLFVGSDNEYYDNYDWKQAETDRNKIIDDYLSQISNNSIDKLKKDILIITKNYNSPKNMYLYSHFNRFLMNLGKEKPNIAIKLINFFETNAIDFLQFLLYGISESNQKNILKNIFLKWIKKNKNLTLISDLISKSNNVDKKLLLAINKKALEVKDIMAINNINVYIVRNTFLKSMFMNNIKLLIKQKESWTHNIWFIDNKFFDKLSIKDIKILLDSLVNVNQISSHEEGILSKITRKNPELLILFFHKRIKRYLKYIKDLQYDTFPYYFFSLKDVFEKKNKIIFDYAIKLINKNISDNRYIDEFAKFLSVCFPVINNELEKEIIILLNKPKYINFLLCFLNKYKGEPFVHNICKEIIKKYINKYDLKIEHILSNVGSTWGENGILNAYKKKLLDLKKIWNNEEKNLSIKKFKIKYEKYLKELISYESKNSEKHIEMRKLESKK